MEHKRTYFLGANWKCNGDTYFVKDIVTHLLNSLSFDPSHLELVVFPGLLHMSLAYAMLHEPVKVGAQNLSRYDVGPYTGEVAAAHIKDYGIEWVIVGH